MYIPRWILHILLLVWIAGTGFAFVRGLSPLGGLIVIILVAGLLIIHPDTRRR